jgi:hypothetical protein
MHEGGEEWAWRMNNLGCVKSTATPLTVARNFFVNSRAAPRMNSNSGEHTKYISNLHRCWTARSAYPVMVEAKSVKHKEIFTS